MGEGRGGCHHNRGSSRPKIGTTSRRGRGRELHGWTEAVRRTLPGEHEANPFRVTGADAAAVPPAGWLLGPVWHVLCSAVPTPCVAKREELTAKESLPRDQEDAVMAQSNVTDEERAELIRRTAEAASALMRGIMRRYLTLIRHAADYTLMNPFGGAPIRGFDASPEHVASMERFFGRDGEAELERVQSYTSGDIVVLVVIERQHGEVGGLPDQDWGRCA